MMEGRGLLYFHTLLIFVIALFISNIHVITSELDIEEQFEGRSTLLERKDEAGNSEPNNPYEGRILKYSRPLWNKNEGESGICMGATIDNPMSEAGYVSDDKGKDSKAAKRVSNPMSDAGSVSGDKGKDSKAAKRVSKVADILKKIGVAYAVDYLKEFYGPKKVKALIVTLLLDELFFESEIYKAFESFLVKLPFLFNEIFEASKPYILNQLPRYSESYGAIKSYILLLLNICNELFEAVKPTTVSTSNINFLSTKLMGSVESPSFLRKSHLSKKLIEALEHVNSREKFLLLLEEYIFALEEYISVFEGYLPGSNFVSDYSNTFVFTFFMCFELIRKYMGRRFLYGRLYQRRP